LDGRLLVETEKEKEKEVGGMRESWLSLWL
jgi:hypothetical protein